LTSHATQKIVDATSTMFDVSFNHLKQGLARAFEGVGINDMESIPGVSELFEEVCNPFAGMNSNWKQKNYLQHEKKFVVILSLVNFSY